MEFEFNWGLNLTTSSNSAIGFGTVHTDMQVLKNFLNLVKIIYVEFVYLGSEKKSIKNMQNLQKIDDKCV